MQDEGNVSTSLSLSLWCVCVFTPLHSPFLTPLVKGKTKEVRANRLQRPLAERAKPLLFALSTFPPLHARTHTPSSCGKDAWRWPFVLPKVARPLPLYRNQRRERSPSHYARLSTKRCGETLGGRGKEDRHHSNAACERASFRSKRTRPCLRRGRRQAWRRTRSRRLGAPPYRSPLESSCPLPHWCRGDEPRSGPWCSRSWQRTQHRRR